MPFSFKNSNITVILLVIVILVLLLSLFGLNAKSNFMFKKNRELTEEINRLGISL